MDARILIAVAALAACAGAAWFVLDAKPSAKDPKQVAVANQEAPNDAADPAGQPPANKTDALKDAKPGGKAAAPTPNDAKAPTQPPDDAQKTGAAATDAAPGDKPAVAAPVAPHNNPAADAAKAADKPSQDNKKGGGGRMSKDDIKSVIGDMKPGVKTCYETLLKSFPDADGTIKLKFAIVNADGVGRVDLEKVAEDSSLYDKELNECLIEQLRNLEFPAPEGDSEVNVTYPFRFAAAE